MAVYEPKVTAVQITPNPAGINATLTIRVSVTEAEVTMYRVSKISGNGLTKRKRGDKLCHINGQKSKKERGQTPHQSMHLVTT